MKTQKLIIIAAIVCLFVGASGAAMARRQTKFAVTGLSQER